MENLKRRGETLTSTTLFDETLTSSGQPLGGSRCNRHQKCPASPSCGENVQPQGSVWCESSPKCMVASDSATKAELGVLVKEHY